MKKPDPIPRWTRRNLLRTAPALCASAMLPKILAGQQAKDPAKSADAARRPFSKFTDVAKTAGLTATMFYGVPESVTYIVEEMGGGCAFFDYDNDGWMDIFILAGRTLEGS